MRLQTGNSSVDITNLRVHSLLKSSKALLEIVDIQVEHIDYILKFDISCFACARVSDCNAACRAGYSKVLE